MNRQTADKVDLFLMGMQGRHEDGKDFFLYIDVDFVSGNKKYSAHIEQTEGGLLSYNFMGNSYKGSFLDVRDFVKKTIPEFDSMLFVYSERGKQITVKADNKDVSSQTKDLQVNEEKAANASTSAVMSDREYFIKPDRAAELLEAIGILAKNGKIRNDKIRKYNQIDHFVELVDPMLRKLCSNKKQIRIVDCGCGKSYLSFALNYYIKEVLGKNCYFTGLDYNGAVIAESARIAKQLHYNNMQFIETDIGAYEPDCQYDMLLTLHACDTATDKALRFALDHKVASIVCVPCCHKEMNSQYHMEGFEDILKYGILKARIADSLTDGLRAMYLEGHGYDVSMLEYISPIDTPKNLMIKAIRTSGKNDAILNKYRKICNELGVKLSIGG
ncbi:MAG: SAM-dependent methyltransferase [Clostridia bacterium]|nr:SAM-dependent methyltransferase [Clostridia bacterium]